MGIAVGSLVGFELDGIALDGVMLGATLGDSVGTNVGALVELIVEGVKLGGSLRCTNGASEGTKVGEVELDGAMLGCSVVIQEGLLVGVSVERTVGAALGLMLDGESVG